MGSENSYLYNDNKEDISFEKYRLFLKERNNGKEVKLFTRKSGYSKIENRFNGAKRISVPYSKYRV